MTLFWTNSLPNNDVKTSYCYYSLCQRSRNEPLRGQSVTLSWYNMATNRAYLRKPAASNCIYTLLCAVFLLFYYLNQSILKS